MLSGILVKVIGAFFSIPLANLYGADGNDIFISAYYVYTAMYVISSAGLPVAVSKMISEARALGRGGEVRRIARVTFLTFLIMGTVLSLTMMLLVDEICLFIGGSCRYAILTVAPTIFFTCIDRTVDFCRNTKTNHVIFACTGFHCITNRFYNKPLEVSWVHCTACHKIHICWFAVFTCFNAYDFFGCFSYTVCCKCICLFIPFFSDCRYCFHAIFFTKFIFCIACNGKEIAFFFAIRLLHEREH